MEVLALCISILSLIAAFMAYYRSVGRQDIRTLEQEINKKVEELRAIVRQVTESIAARVRSGYEHSIRTISDLQSQIGVLRVQATQEIQEDLRLIGQTLDKLAERAAHEIEDLQTGVTFALVEAEVGLRLAVDDAKAHLKVIKAKRQLTLDHIAILCNDLTEAEGYVRSALKDLEEARSLAVGHHQSLVALQKQAEKLVAAIQAKADTIKDQLADLIKRSSRLLAEMMGRTSVANIAV